MMREELLPPPDEGRTFVDVPVIKVTLLEDRAQVVRRGTVELAAGRNRLAIDGLAPVLQDVSVRVEATRAKVIDARARRAMRVRREDRPDEVAQLEDQIEALARGFRDRAEDRARAEDRRAKVLDMVHKGIGEIPEDAGWGLVAHQAWHDTLEGLFRTSRSLDERAQELFAEQEDLLEDIKRLSEQRFVAERPDVAFRCRLEIDVEGEGGPCELQIEYVVPNALWRPLHVARLTSESSSEPSEAVDDQSTLTVRTLAAVWQNTGEDWTDVELCFSTARSSLGTDPPLLQDDLLQAKRKSEEVVVARREVAVQRAAVGGGGSSASAGPIDLPGVDDGGETRTLTAEHKSTVPSDGRPSLIMLAESTAPAEIEWFAAPELAEKVFVRARSTHSGAVPILAGPVELVRRAGTVGWSQLLFVAPQERFELGFGPDEALRMSRKVQRSEKVDHVDGWQHKTTTVRLFFSNLGTDPRTVEVVERIPVSEIEHVRVSVLEEHTAPMPVVDDDGFCRWKVELAGRGHVKVRLTFRVSTAPGVRPV